jgi:hypothetical protein
VAAARARKYLMNQPGAHNLDHLLNSEAVRGQDRFGAAPLRTAGEQFERALRMGGRQLSRGRQKRAADFGQRPLSFARVTLSPMNSQTTGGAKRLAEPRARPVGLPRLPNRAV